MDRYNKLLLTICSLLLLNAFKVQSQIIPDSISDSIYYDLTLNNNQKKNKDYDKVAFRMNLFIQNKSNDSIVIKNFNNNIYHISEVHFRADEKRVFFWSLLTLSNEEPENIIMVLPNQLIPKQKKQVTKNETIVIPPNSVFVSDVFLLRSPFVIYPKGFYKLCLFYEDDKNCIAEIIIEIKS